MNILHIIPNLRKGGAERLVLDICNALQNHQNVKIKLITFTEQNEYPFLTKNIDWEIIPASVNLSILGKTHLFIEKLQTAIEQFQPDSIHTHLFEAEIVSRSCYYPKAKWFSHGHDNMVQFENFSYKTLLNKTKFTNYYEKKYLFNRYKINGGNQFIAISKDTKNYFDKTAKTFNTTLLNNAINFDVFYKQPNINKSSNTIKLVNIGSLVNKKNQAFLLDVANILISKSVDFQIHFLGDGINKEELIAKANQLNLTDKIFFHGNVNNVEQHLWNFDIYVHSATYEPFGLVLLEAMAAGLPVITLDGKGNRDIMEQGKNGYMIHEQNADTFAQTIIDLWNNQQKYHEMSAYAQKFAKQYDIKTYADKLLHLYTEVIMNKNNNKLQ